MQLLMYYSVIHTILYFTIGHKQKSPDERAKIMSLDLVPLTGASGGLTVVKSVNGPGYKLII